MTFAPPAPGLPLPSRAAGVGFVVGAACLASAAPLLAYAGSLSLFGAPHALAELRYVDGRFAARVGRGRAAALLAILAVVVGLRALVLAGRAPALGAYVLELGLVATTAFVVVPGLASRPGRALVAVAVGAAISVGSYVAPVSTIVVLAILHNATPVGFLLDQDALRRRVVAPVLLAFVAVPLVVASGLPSRALDAVGAFAPDAGFRSAGALAHHLRVFVPPSFVGAGVATSFFAACAYLQLLHYGVVLGVLPRLVGRDPAVPDRPALPWPAARPLVLAIAAVGVGFAVAFVADFTSTRAVYGLLAAVHAWIEVPVLLLALGARPVAGAAAAALPGAA